MSSKAQGPVLCLIDVVCLCICVKQRCYIFSMCVRYKIQLFVADTSMKTREKRKDIKSCLTLWMTSTIVRWVWNVAFCVYLTLVMAVLLFLSRFHSEFQANLLSSHRKFVTRIDVVELTSSLSGRGDNLSLFLFSDSLEVLLTLSRAAEVEQSSHRSHVGVIVVAADLPLLLTSHCLSLTSAIEEWSSGIHTSAHPCTHTPWLGNHRPPPASQLGDPSPTPTTLPMKWGLHAD